MTVHTQTRHAASVDTKPWIERSARIGYLAKGVVYLIIGGLAAAAAFGGGGRTTGSEGAFQTILQQPFGQVLLAAIALGLAGYAFWKLVQSTVDPEHKGTDAKGLATRGYYMVSAIIHAALVVTAVRMITGSSSGSGGGTEEKTAELMSEPFGQWLVGLVGVVIVVAACMQAYRGYQAKFTKRMRYHEVSAEARRWLVRLGRTGLVARGIVFAMIGGFLVVAAVRANPDEAKGLGETLATLQGQPYGPWLMGALAIGLALYGAHQIAKAKYRHISP